MMFSVMCHDFCHCVDEKEECDLPEGGKGGIQDAGWETYWGEEDMKTVQYSMKIFLTGLHEVISLNNCKTKANLRPN